MNTTTAATTGVDLPLPDLQGEFPPHTCEQWKAAAEALLKGAPFDKKLLTPTPEGITWRPIYMREDAAGLAHLADFPGAENPVRSGHAAGRPGGCWGVSQEIACETPAEFNAIARAEIERGQTELNIPAGCGGVRIRDLAGMETLLAGIPLDRISLYFRCRSSALPLAGLLAAFCEKQGVDMSKLHGCVEADPLAVLATTGSLPMSLEAAYQDMQAVVRALAARAPGMQTVAVRAAHWHDAGGSAVQELAFALAAGLAHLRALEAQGLHPAETLPRMRFSLASGNAFFTDIAKLRAFRFLWARIARELAGGIPPTPHVHVRTSTWSRTAYDIHVNLLRATTESFAAAAGGCDSLHVGPFDGVVRAPDELSRRVARNTHHILAGECGMDRVIDPAGGSWFVECLTDQIGRAAWALFQDIEKRGGMAAAILTGDPQQLVQLAAAQRFDALARRREIKIGLNQYPNPAERPARPPAEKDEAGGAACCAGGEPPALAEGDRFTAVTAAARAGATLCGIFDALHAGHADGTRCAAVPMRRHSQAFEELRSAVESVTPPLEILQVQLGESRHYRARADWTAGFFQTGGFKVVPDGDHATVEAALAAVERRRPACAILVGQDETYAQQAAPLAAALKARLPGLHLLLAGAPGGNEAAWRAAGIDGFVSVRSNLLETLAGLARKMGVTA